MPPSTIDAAAALAARCGEANQTWIFWGLYPSMILMQDGRLFYSGSHVFGNGTARHRLAIYDYGANTSPPVPGCRTRTSATSR